MSATPTTLAAALLEIERLHDHIYELECLAGLTAPERPFQILNIRPMSERLLGVLMKLQFVTRDAVFDALYGLLVEADQPNPKLIDVYLVDCRRALRRRGIELQTVWGKGWFIRPEDKTRLRAELGLPAPETKGRAA